MTTIAPTVEVDPNRPTTGMIRTPVSGEYEDQYLAKLVKYIPAEVLALFVPLIALADKLSSDRQLWMWITVGFGVIATIGYNRWHATEVIPGQVTAAHGPNAPEAQRLSDVALNAEIARHQPAWYFYVLSLVAFAVWGIAAAAPVRALLHVDAALAEYLLAAGTFAIPLLDVTLKHLTDQFKRLRAAPVRATSS